MRKGFSSIQIIVAILTLIIFASAVYFLQNKENSSPSSKNNFTQTPPTTQQIQPAIKTKVIPITSPVKRFTYAKEGDIYVYDLEKGENKKLTDYKYNSDPVISLDGTKIAYLSTPKAVVEGNQLKTNFADVYQYKNIWIINSDGTDPIQVTNDLKKRFGISWSNDNGSNQIVFTEDGSLVKYNLKDRSLSVLAKGTSPVFAYNDNSYAFLSNEDKTLNIQTGNGAISTFNNDKKISGINWSHDNKYLFFTSVDSLKQKGNSSLGLKYSIWYYSLADKKVGQVTQETQGMHSPNISPNNLYLVTSQGSGYADAGNINLSLVILKLNSNLSLLSEIKLDQFKGPDFFEKEKQSMFPSGNAAWINDKEFLIILDELLKPQPNPRGLYKLNLENLSAQRLLEFK